MSVVGINGICMEKNRADIFPKLFDKLLKPAFHYRSFFLATKALIDLTPLSNRTTKVECSL